MKYIDAEKLKDEIKHLKIDVYDEAHQFDLGARSSLTFLESFIDSLQQEKIDMGEVSDGYHTFNELYYYRMLYNAAFFNLLPKEWVHKSKRHHTGEECFGGGWFIVMANLPTGQVSNHYELKDWDLFKVPEKEFADEWDGHTPQEAAERIKEYLQQEPPDFPTTDEQIKEFLATHPKIEVPEKYKNPDWLLKKQEQPEMDFETEYAKFTNDPDELEYAFPIDLADYKDFAWHFYELGRLSNK